MRPQSTDRVIRSHTYSLTHSHALRTHGGDGNCGEEEAQIELARYGREKAGRARKEGSCSAKCENQPGTSPSLSLSCQYLPYGKKGRQIYPGLPSPPWHSPSLYSLTLKSVRKTWQRAPRGRGRRGRRPTFLQSEWRRRWIEEDFKVEGFVGPSPLVVLREEQPEGPEGRRRMPSSVSSRR